MTAKQLLDQAFGILDTYQHEGRLPSVYLINHADFRTLVAATPPPGGNLPHLSGALSPTPALFGVPVRVTEDREPYTRKELGL